MSAGPLMIDIAGTALTDVERERLRHPLVGGVILFSRNYRDPEQLSALCAEIHALREVYGAALKHNDPRQAQADLSAWLSWATRSRLEPFKKLAKTLKTHFAGVISGMLDNRSNAFVEAMNGLLQQAKRAARGFRTAGNFIAVAYLRMSKLAHLPDHPFTPASEK